MNRIKLVLFVALGIIIIVAVLIISGVGRKPLRPQPATLEFWGVEDERFFNETINKFTAQNRHITVNYSSFSPETYEETLVNRLAAGKGPDIFLLKSSWITKHKDKISPLPQNSFNFFVNDFEKYFADLAFQDLVGPASEQARYGAGQEYQIFGLPLYLDTPALFYNKDIFNAAGIAETPRTWDEVTQTSRELTKKTPAGDITRSGFAFGAFGNIEHAFELLSTLIFQYGDPIIDRKTGAPALSKNSEEALNFYASFNEGGSNFSWNDRLPNSLDMFAEGKAAMALGFPRDVRRVRAKNPNLFFGIAPFPQRKDARTPQVYGNYFFPTVYKFSKNPVQAWQFILFLAMGEGTKPYLEKSGHSPARRDLIQAGPQSPDLEIYIRQALIARGFPVPEEKAAGLLFKEAVESVVTKRLTPKEAINRLSAEMKLLLP